MSFQKGNTFVFGEIPSALKWDQLWRNDDALADGSGLDDGSVTAGKLALTTQSYTPVLTGLSSNPNLGSTGTIAGKYTEIGKWIFGEVLILANGTGVSAGSGSYLITLPTAVSGLFHTASTIAGEASSIGSGYFRDESSASGSLNFVLGVYSLNGGSGGVGQVFMTINAGRVITNTQTALAAGDRFSLNFAYMAP